jgi:hypothetical protein
LRSVLMLIITSTALNATMVVSHMSMPMLNRIAPSAAMTRPAIPDTVVPAMSQRLR